MRCSHPLAAGPSPLDERCEAASAEFDQQGRLWIAMLKPRLPRAGWDVFLTGLVNGKWLDPAPLSGGKGMDRIPALVLQGREALVAFQTDDMPQSWSDVDQMAKANSDIYLASVDTTMLSGSGVQERGVSRLQPLTESEDIFEPATIRVERGEDASNSVH